MSSPPEEELGYASHYWQARKDKSMTQDQFDTAAATPAAKSVSLSLPKGTVQTVGAIVVALALLIGGYFFFFTGTSNAQLIHDAAVAIKAGDLVKGETLLNQEIAQNTKNDNSLNAIAYFNLGVISGLKRQYNAALANYQSAIRLSPRYQAALYNLGVTYMDMGMNYRPQAITAFNTVISMYPNDARALWNMGLLQYREGQTTEGIVNMKKAISIDPSYAARAATAGITLN
jgi:tetratricopeptide (TPR) repeat protein